MALGLFYFGRFLICDSSVLAIILGQSLGSQAVGMKFKIYFLHIVEIKASPC